MKKIILAILTIFILFSVSCSEINHENIDETDIDETDIDDTNVDETDIDETDVDETNKVSEQEPLPVTEVDINDETVQKIYTKITEINEAEVAMSFPIQYQAKTAYFKDLPTAIVSYTICTIIDLPGEKDFMSSATTIKNYESLIDDGTITGYTGDEKMYKKVFFIPIEKFEEALVKMFGNEVSFEFPDYIFYGLTARFKKMGDSYALYLLAAGGMTPKYNQNFLIKAETDGENLYLYDKYAKLGQTGVYADSNETVLLYSYDNYEDWHEYKYGGWGSNEFIEDFEYLMQPYKHTFKKAEDGSYYWISTEMISEIPN